MTMQSGTDESRHSLLALHVIYRLVQKTGTLFVRLNFVRLNFIKYLPIFKLISPSEPVLLQLFICNNTVTKDPAKPQGCRYTTLSNISVLKATNENKTTSVATYFKKLTTGNNVFIVSVSI